MMKYALLLASILLSHSSFADNSNSSLNILIDRVDGYSFSGQHEIADHKKYAYPAPPAGYKIAVIRPPYDYKNTDNNQNKKIEVLLKKPSEVDSCNSYGIAGTLRSVDVPSASYLTPYYKLELGDTTMTLMGCGDNKTHTADVGISLNADPTDRTQVSSTFDIADAIVLYVPQDVKVSYRIWQPGTINTVNDAQ